MPIIRMPNRKQRDLYASREWKQARAECRRRHANRCWECGGKDQLAVHHIIPVAQGGEPYDQVNLVLLCRAHHDLAEAGARAWRGDR